MSSLNMGKLKSRTSTGATLISPSAPSVFSKKGRTKAATFGPTRPGRRLMVMKATDFDMLGDVGKGGILLDVNNDFANYLVNFPTQ